MKANLLSRCPNDQDESWTNPPPSQQPGRTPRYLNSPAKAKGLLNMVPEIVERLQAGVTPLPRVIAVSFAVLRKRAAATL